MGWLNRLFGGAGQAKGDANILWLYVRCNRCNSVVAVRVNRRNDIGLDEDGESYVLFKEIMDGKCFQLMRAEIHYDPRFNVVSQQVSGAKFITAEEYQAAKAQPPGAPA